jgi:hypothetical protein
MIDIKLSRLVEISISAGRNTRYLNPRAELYIIHETANSIISDT